MNPDIAEALAEKGLKPVEENKAEAGAAAAANGGQATAEAGSGGAAAESPYLKEGKFDEESFIKDVFGDEPPFKSVADIKAAKLTETLKDYPNLKTKIMEYEGKLNEKRNPFYNERIAKLNVLAKETKIENLNLLSTLLNTDIEKADAKTLLKLQTLMDHPEFASQEDTILRRIEKKYNFAAIDVDETLSDDEKAGEKKLLQMNMDIEASKIRKSFSDLINKAVIQKPEEVEAAEIASHAEARKGWEPVIGEIGKSFTKIKIPAGTVTVDFDVPKDTLESATKLALDFASKSFKGNLTRENAAQVIDYFTSVVKLANEAKINAKVMEYARGLTEAEWIKQAHNPSGEFNKEKGQSGQAVKSTQDGIFDLISRNK